MHMRTLLGAAAIVGLGLIGSAATANDFVGSPVTSGDLIQIVVDAEDDLSDADVKAIGAKAGIDLTLNSVYSDDANLYVAWVGGTPAN